MSFSENNTPLLIPKQWRDYELLDSGDGMKRERWGNQILIRPEVAAYWARRHPAAWDDWNGWFEPTSSTHHGHWKWKISPLKPWRIQYDHLHFLIRPTSSKQVGLFPEQSPNWDWCIQKIKAAQRPIKVLNLFGYSGAASIAAASAGASVCHVDASKAMVGWCAENTKISHLYDEKEKPPIRFIVDDCY
ncbi:MAG: SAM-dependent methyltransferase, partial [Verrucomicrobia bacterium]